MAKAETPPPIEDVLPKKRRGKWFFLILIVGVIFVLVAGGVAYWLLSASDETQDEEVAAEEEDDAHADSGHPAIYEKLEQFTVNLLGQDSYLQTEVQLLVADTEVQQMIKQRMPEVRDTMIRLLSSKTTEELGEPEGKSMLADEIQQKLNELLGIKKKSKGIKKVLFGSFIIQ